ncbi:MAG: BON domain-containing protein [Francisellaceae bacterium]|jgi:osmotically-inducible protein OsmY|nr:BON domain-containing protein [Francisellaceae bacterium]MBT6206462.1 BON domain-containing protein [Francisellaceae bacterium]MBT6537895.1 BON domain-containing protein [Francisellaceae bacterium]
MRKTFTLILILTILSGCQTTGKSYFGTQSSSASKASFFNDQSVIMNVSMALSKEKDLWKNSHINILHHNNSLLLVGQTNIIEYKEKSERIASNADGIDKIYNQIRITKPISYAQRAKDAWITTQVKAKYFAEKKIGFNDVKVLTENNRVFLMGTLSSKDQELAVKVASSVDDVQEVLKIFDEPTT